MDSIVEKLSHIETTAEAIVERAEARKCEIEQQIQSRRDKFDEDLETETQKKLEHIRGRANEKVEQILDGQRRRNQSTIEALKKDFETNHTAYAQEILKHIIEV